MTRKYILKPGRHQFAPGSHAAHENENLSDEEAEWYLKQYPHIAALFEAVPDDNQSATDNEKTACRVSVREPADTNILIIPTPFGEINEIENESVKSQSKSVKSKINK